MTDDARHCGDCSLCCKVLGVVAVDKGPMIWCKHCDPKKGICKIYDSRPNDCRWFYCRYLLHAEIGDHWKPVTCRMVLNLESSPSGDVLAINVDSGRVDLWRKDPYYSDIRRWAETGVHNGTQVVVRQGLDTIIVFPNGEKNVGRVKPGQQIFTSMKPGPGGPEFDAEVLDPGDPRLSRVTQHRRAPVPV